MPPLSRSVAPLVSGIALGALSSVWCHGEAGPTLGLYLGPLWLLTIAAPPLLLSRKAAFQRILMVAGLAMGTGAVWLLSNSTLGVGAYPAFICSLLTASWLYALSGFGVVLGKLKVPVAPASATTVMLGGAWLTWPVWLSRALSGHDPVAGARLCTPRTGSQPCHPQSRHMESSPLGGADLAYKFMTNLNQDVAYPSESSPLIYLVVYLTVGVIFQLFAEDRTAGKLSGSSPNEVASLI